jgi:hypothetical protein
MDTPNHHYKVECTCRSRDGRSETTTLEIDAQTPLLASLEARDELEHLGWRVVSVGVRKDEGGGGK